MALVGSLLVSIAAKTDQLERDLAKARGEISKLKGSVQDVSHSFQSMGASLTGLAAGAISVQALSSAVKDLVRTGVEMKNLQVSLAGITGSTAAGQREFAFLRDTANTLGVDLKGLAESYRGLTAATRGTAMEGEDTRKLFVALSTASRNYGMSTEQTGRAIQAFTQIISKGKVEQEELRGQLSEAIPGAMQIAARAFGVGTAELGKMVEKGLEASKFAKAFTDQLARETPLATELAGKGFANLGNEILELKNRIANSGLLQFLDALAAKGAAILATSRQAAEETRRLATEALGAGAGQATPAEMLEADKLAQDTQRQPATSAGWLPWNWKPGFGQAEAARAKLAKMKAEMDRRHADKNTGDAALLEAGLAPSQQSNKAAMAAVEQQQEAERTKGQYNALLNRLDATREAEEKAASAAKTRAREAASEAKRAASEAQRLAQEREQEEERFAQETMQRLREIQAEEDRSIESLRDLAGNYGMVKEARDADTASMLQAQLATSQYAAEAERLAKTIADVQKAEAKLPGLRADAERSAAALETRQGALGELDRYEEYLGLGPSKATREYLKVKADVGPIIAAGGPEAERARRVVAAYEPELRKLQGVADEFADSFLSSIERATTGGIKSFKDFVTSVAQDLNRILTQQYIRPAVSQLFEKGIGLAMNLLNGGGGGIPGGAPALPSAGWSQAGQS
jgi:tape measure domain-containing protein